MARYVPKSLNPFFNSNPYSLVRLFRTSYLHVALNVLGITWVLVYRTDKYKRLKAEVEKQSKKRKYDNRISTCVRRIGCVITLF